MLHELQSTATIIHKNAMASFQDGHVRGVAAHQQVSKVLRDDAMDDVLCKIGSSGVRQAPAPKPTLDRKVVRNHSSLKDLHQHGHFWSNLPSIKTSRDIETTSALHHLPKPLHSGVAALHSRSPQSMRACARTRLQVEHPRTAQGPTDT